MAALAEWVVVRDDDDDDDDEVVRVEDRLDVLLEERLDVLLEERLDVLLEERLVLLVEEKLEALIEEGVIDDVIWVEEIWNREGETADVGMAESEGADDMAVDNGREKVVVGVDMTSDGGPVSTLGYGIEKNTMPVVASCDDRVLGILVGRLGKLSCVASTELIEESAKDKTSNALEGELVEV